jgi:hypothetical protein
MTCDPRDQIHARGAPGNRGKGAGIALAAMRKRTVQGGVALVLALMLAVNPAFAAPSYDGTDTHLGTGALATENDGTCSAYAAQNSAFGFNALNANCGGRENTGLGSQALSLSISDYNTAVGASALQRSNGPDAYQNTAVGTQSLEFNSTGNFNTGLGAFSGEENQSGVGNTALGAGTLIANVSGDINTAVGSSALQNDTGAANVAVGAGSLQGNTSGANNTAIGSGALSFNSTGGDNTVLGNRAGRGVTESNGGANAAGSSDTFIGAHSGPGSPTQLSNATAIGANAVVSQSDSLVLGASGVKVGIGTQAPSSKLTVAGTIESTSGGLMLPDSSVQSTAGVTSVSASGPLVSSGGLSPILSLGTVGTANGGTGITTAPTAAGQFLRSTGVGTWGVGSLQASDLPASSGSYIQNGTGLQSSANFNIDGNGLLGGTLTAAGTGNSGIGTSTPHSLLQVGKPSTSYGSYLQLPLVTSSSGPPATDCNTSTFVGRVVVQYSPSGNSSNSTTLWVCLSNGKWAAH